MKKYALLLGILVCFLLCEPLRARAEFSLDETLQTLIDLSGEDLTLPDTESPVPTLPTLLDKGKALFSDTIGAPLRMTELLLGVILLSALAQSLRQGEVTGVVYEYLCTLCAVRMLAQPLLNVFSHAAAALSRTSDFMLGFTGIYGGILAASGSLTGAAVWQGSMALACEISMEIATKLLFPLLSLCLVMSITDAVNPDISLSGLIGAVQKLTAWILGLLMALFLGLLSVQTIITSAADRAGTKAAKFVISGAVPIVGGAVSDAYAAVLGSMGVLRSSVGVTGIILVVSILAPILLELGLYRAAVLCTGAVAELFDVPPLVRLFRNAGSVLSAGFSAAVSIAVLFVFSAAVTLSLGGNAS